MNSTSIIKRITLIATLLGTLTILVSSCYREKPITSELGKPKYKIDSSIPEVAKLYKESSIQIIYQFDPATVNWNLGKGNKGVYSAIDANDPDKMAALKANLPYLIDQFINLYPQDFQREHMPLRVILCDTIKGVRSRDKEEFSWHGIDHLSINIYREGDHYKVNRKKVPWTDMETYYQAAIPQLHIRLFEHLSAYKAEWPHSFFDFAEGSYDINLVKRADAPNFNPREYGFWTYDEDSMATAWYHTITKEKDVSDFVTRMVTKSETENLEAMEGFPILRAKYDILRTFIKEQYKFDLQEIGNKYRQSNP